MKLSLSLIIAIIFVFSNLAGGQKIYLSPEGNDSNPGSIDKPLATLTAACDKAREYRKSSKPSMPAEIIALAGEYLDTFISLEKELITNKSKK